MDFSGIEGLDAVKEQLRKLIGASRLEHPMIFYGPRGIGKSLVAREMAKYVLDYGNQHESGRRLFDSGTHPDFLVVKTAGDTIKIEDARAITEFLAVSPNLASRRALYIKQVQKMSIEAFNALLKLLEEPPQDALIILGAESFEQIPETVISRCLVIPFPRLPPASLERIYRDQLNAPPEAISLLVQISAGGVDKTMVGQASSVMLVNQFCADFLQKPARIYADGAFKQFKAFIDAKADSTVYLCMAMHIKNRILSSKAPGAWTNALEVVIEYSKAHEANANKMLCLGGMFRQLTLVLK